MQLWKSFAALVLVAPAVDGQRLNSRMLQDPRTVQMKAPQNQIGGYQQQMPMQFQQQVEAAEQKMHPQAQAQVHPINGPYGSGDQEMAATNTGLGQESAGQANGYGYQQTNQQQLINGGYGSTGQEVEGMQQPPMQEMPEASSLQQMQQAPMQQMPMQQTQMKQGPMQEQPGSMQPQDLNETPSAPSQGGQAMQNKLEFVHITKTGGSAIELAAASAGVTWGACHYAMGPPQCRERADWEGPQKRLVERMPAGLKYAGEPWHSPPHWLFPNPMEGSDTFVVVRNPYDRIVSEYYCSSYGYKGEDADDPVVFNNWLTGNLTLLGEKLQGHMLPQNYYVYDEHGDRVVTHILRYENLQSEFDDLMQLYGLPIRMPTKTSKSAHHTYSPGMKQQSSNLRGAAAATRHMTVEDISPQNIELINRAYERDFEFFGYPMIPVQALSPEQTAGVGMGLPEQQQQQQQPQMMMAPPQEMPQESMMQQQTERMVPQQQQQDQMQRGYPMMPQQQQMMMPQRNEGVMQQPQQQQQMMPSQQQMMQMVPQQQAQGYAEDSRATIHHHQQPQGNTMMMQVPQQQQPPMMEQQLQGSTQQQGYSRTSGYGN